MFVHVLSFECRAILRILSVEAAYTVAATEVIYLQLEVSVN